MAVSSEYEDAINRVFNRENTEQKSEYDSSIKNVFAPDPKRYKGSQYVAKDKDVGRVTEATKIAREVKMPVDFVERNLDDFKKQKDKSTLDYETIISRSPQLGKWMEDPNKAAVSNDDLDTLSRVERNQNRIRAYKDEPGYMEDLAKAGKSGGRNLHSAGLHLGAAYGLVDIDDVADDIAANNRAIKKAQEQLPGYAREFNEAMEKEGADVDRAASRFVGSFKKFKDKKIVDGLTDFTVGGLATVGETIDQIGSAVVRPRGAIRSTTESLAFSAPALAAGAAGAKGGAVGGGLIAGPLGAGIGGVGGFVGGTFVGSAATETGAWINQALEERGYDVTDANQIRAAYSNKRLMAEIRGEAERKGVTTAGVDALFAMVGGKFLKGAKGSGKVAAVKAGAKELGVQATGEAASEFAGQVAAREGDLSKVSLGEAITEGVVSMGQSAGTSAIGASVRKGKQIRSEFSVDPVEAAEEIAVEASAAQESLTEIQAIQQLGQLAVDSELQTRDPEMFAEFMESVNLEEGSQAVYFQKDDWDNYWKGKGESPVAKAEELLGSADAYQDASNSGQPIPVPLSDFVSQIATEPEFEEMLQIVRTKPDGYTISESVKVIQAAPGLIEEVAVEAQRQQAIELRAEEGARAVQENIEAQLVAAGRDKIEAVPIVEFYRTLGIKEGVSPQELADKYGLNISGAFQDLAPGRQLFQDEKSASGIAQERGTIEEEVKDGQEPRERQLQGQIPGSPERIEAEKSRIEKPLDNTPRGRKHSTKVREAAREYAARSGLNYRQQKEYVKVDEERAARIADAFEQMEHDPQNPTVERAYKKMIAETLAQYQVIKESGLQIEVIKEGQPDPYQGNSKAMINDVLNNNHMWLYPTDAGFGTLTEIQDNPLLEMTDEYIGDFQLTANDIFRIVHDYFGHVKEGNGFRARGEENAWQSHVRMYSPEAARAMTTETRGQNSWLNFGPHGEANRTAKTEDTVFADQKIGLLPDWVMEEGLSEDQELDLFPESETKVFFQGGLDGFHSKLIKTLEDKIQGEYATADQVRGLAKNLKPEELKWLGLEEFLYGKDKVSKDELLDHLNNNMLDIEIYEDEFSSNEDRIKAEDIDWGDGKVVEPSEDLLNDEVEYLKDDIEYIYSESWEETKEEYVEENYPDQDIDFDDLDKSEQEIALEKFKEEMSDRLREDAYERLTDSETATFRYVEDNSDWVIEGNDNFGWSVADNRGNVVGEPKNSFDEARDLAFEYMIDEGMIYFEDEESQYQPYTLPGGGDYREIKLVQDKDSRTGLRIQRQAVMKDQLEKELGFKINSERLNDIIMRGSDALPRNVSKEAFKIADRIQMNYAAFQTFSRGHFDNNTVAHVRSKHRVDENKDPLFFMEEIQSDWHKEVGPFGYYNDEMPADKKEKQKKLREDLQELQDDFESKELELEKERDRLRDLEKDIDRDISQKDFTGKVTLDNFHNRVRRMGRVEFSGHIASESDLDTKMYFFSIYEYDGPDLTVEDLSAMDDLSSFAEGGRVWILDQMQETGESFKEVLERGINKSQNAFVKSFVRNADIDAKKTGKYGIEFEIDGLDGRRVRQKPGESVAQVKERVNRELEKVYAEVTNTEGREKVTDRYIERFREVGSQVDETYDKIKELKKEYIEKKAALEKELIKANHREDAPFRKNWFEFALKRMIIHAIENNYKQIGWTDGETQVQRYRNALTTKVDSIRFNKETGEFNAIKDGTVINKQEFKKQEDLEKLIGKGAAKQLYEGEPGKDGFTEVASEDVRIGGAFMRTLYDKKIVNAAKKIGKQFGVEVEERRVMVGETETAPAYIMKITPELEKFIEGDGFSLFQGEDSDPRGKLEITGNGNFNISLLEKADKSTFFHEAGHYFLEVLKDMSATESASQELKDDFKTILDWLGVESADQIDTEHHEKWARGFEAYLREGKAPSSRLRKAFNTFKVWLTSVYRNLTELNVQLTPEVRDVMDRMFATQEEIDEARKRTLDAPLFTDPVQAGMTAAQWEKYQDLQAESELRPKEEMMKRLMKDREKKLKIEKKKIREEMTDEINQVRVYNTMAILQKGEMADGSDLPEGTFPLKLNKTEFNIRFPQYAKNTNFRGMFNNDNSVSLEIAASILGYESVDFMVQEIANAPKKKDAIEFATNQKVELLAQDLLNSEEISAEAEKLVHNEPRAKRLRMEYEALAEMSPGLVRDVTRRITMAPIPDAQIKRYAKQTIMNMPVGEIKPNTYRLAERRFRKDQGKLLAAKDIAGAFEAKQKEIINHALYRAATEAKDQHQKDKKLIKKVFQKDEKLAKTRDMNLINAARAVLSRYGLGRVNKDPNTYLSQMKNYDPDAYETVSSILVGVMESPDDFKNIPFGQYVDVIDSVKALWDLAKEAKEIEVKGKKFLIADANEDLIEGMRKFEKPAAMKKYNETATDLEKMKVELLGVKAQVRRFEHWVDVMDLGDIEGPFRKFLFEATSDATSEFLEANKEYKNKFATMSEEIRKTIDINKPILSDELKFKFKHKGELLGALLHTGNESNLKKLLVGREWGMMDEDGNLITKDWDAFIQRMWDEGILTKADYDYVQSLWDLMEELKPGAQRSHKKLFGFYFDEITSKEFETPFGTYRGGYAPAAVDPMAVMDIARRAELEEFTKGHTSYTYPASGGRGFTKSRVANFNKPLNIQLELVGKHIEDVLRFSIIKPAVVDAAKIVMSEDFKSAMGEIDPVVIDKMIKPALNRADKNTIQTVDPSGSRLIRRAGGTLRQAASMQLMFANVINTFEQIAGFSIAATRVSPKNLSRGMYKYMMNPRTTAEAVSEKSVFMRGRTTDQMFEIEKRAKNIFSEESNFKKMREWSKQHVFFMQSFFQNLIDTVIWSASYDESITKGLSDEAAVTKADADIRLTQSSMRPMDISNIESNTTLRFFQMFMNFFNMMANVNTSNFTKLYYEDIGMKKKFAKGLYLYAMGFASVAVISAALRKAASGGLDEDEDGEYIDDLYDVFIGSQIDLATAMVPAAGPAVNAGLNQVNDKQYDDRVSASPAISAITAVSGTVSKAATGKLTDEKGVKGDVRDSLTALGIVTGLPLYPISKPINYSIDVQRGRARPSGAVDVLRGVVTGKPGVK